MLPSRNDLPRDGGSKQKRNGSITYKGGTREIVRFVLLAFRFGLLGVAFLFIALGQGRMKTE